MPERLSRWQMLVSGRKRSVLSRLQAMLPASGSSSALLTAFLVLAVATGMKPLAESWTGQTLPPFIFSYPAVVIAAVIGGPTSGLIIALVSIMIAWVVFLPPSWNIALNAPGDAVALLIYSLTSIGLALVIGFSRYALEVAVASEAMRDYDAREAVHRVKNVLAVVQSLTWGTMREATDLADFGQRISSRFEALGQAQNILLGGEKRSAIVRDLVTAAMCPFLPDQKIALDCAEDVTVPARFVHGLTLALFELATNSAKHGALCISEGSINISCIQQADDVVLRWLEQTVRPVSDHAPSTREGGFGSRLIRAALRNEADTSVSYERSAVKVEATFRWPSAAAGPD